MRAAGIRVSDLMSPRVDCHRRADQTICTRSWWSISSALQNAISPLGFIIRAMEMSSRGTLDETLLSDGTQNIEASVECEARAAQSCRTTESWACRVPRGTTSARRRYEIGLSRVPCGYPLPSISHALQPRMSARLRTRADWLSQALCECYSGTTLFR